MGAVDNNLIKLLMALRDAHSLVVEAINSYLAVVAPMELDKLAIAGLFPKELRNMLDITLKDDKWIITPRDYLGSENFKRIAEIVRQHGGEYKPAGKESHFIIPKVVKQSRINER